MTAPATRAVLSVLLAAGFVPAAQPGSAESLGRGTTAGSDRVEILIVQPDEDPASWTYEPADVIADPGTTVVWRNAGTVAHTVTAEDGAFSSPNLEPGATWEWTFPAPGDAPYHCSPHPWMRAVVRIRADRS